MARPPKDGQDYFSHDTDMANDEKVLAIRSLYGWNGYAYYNALLEKIYRSADGCIEVKTDLQQSVLAKYFEVEVPKFNKYVNDCAEIGLFDKDKLSNEHIIFSNGASKRRDFILKERERAREWNREHRANKQDGDGNKSGDAEKYIKGKFGHMVQH